MIRPAYSIGARRSRAGLTWTYAVGMREPDPTPSHRSRALPFAVLRASWAAVFLALGLFVTFRHCLGVFRP